MMREQFATDVPRSLWRFLLSPLEDEESKVTGNTADAHLQLPFTPSEREKSGKSPELDVRHLPQASVRDVRSGSFNERAF